MSGDARAAIGYCVYNQGIFDLGEKLQLTDEQTDILGNFLLEDPADVVMHQDSEFGDELMIGVTLIDADWDYNERTYPLTVLTDRPFGELRAEIDQKLRKFAVLKTLVDPELARLVTQLADFLAQDDSWGLRVACYLL